MDLTNCVSCGRPVPSKAHFCQYCGSALLPSNTSSTDTSSRSPEPNSLEGPDGTTPPAFNDSTYVPLPPGTRLRDRYVLEKQLGQGGFGRAYRAQDTGRFNEPIVIKELTPSVQGTAALKKAEELFEREAATLHRLEHPQIPRFWEIFQAQKRLFLVEDCVVGHTYEQLQTERQGQHFSEQEITQLFRDLLPVLSYLHRQGVIHRDISPDNIMRRDRDGLPVLIDLGGVKQVAIDVATEIASIQSGFSSGGGTRLGKIGYAPDEQMRLGLVAPHSDLYALAVTALVLMTGKSPQQLQDPQSLDWTWNQELNISSNFSSVLHTMLAPRPVDRYQSADEVLQALNPPREIPPTQIHQPVSPPPTPPVPELISTPETVARTVNVAQPQSQPPTIQNAQVLAPEQSKPLNIWKWGCVTVATFILLVFGLVLIGIDQADQADEPEDSASPSPELSVSPSPQASPSSSTSGQFQRVQIRGLEPFEHKTGTFSMDAPQQWEIKDNSKPGEVIVVWTDPSGNSEVVADLFDFRKEPSQTELTQILEQFLKDTFSNKPDFFIEKPRPQKDGSVLLIWGYTGTATGNIKVKLLGNSFIENKGRRIAVLTYLVPSEQFEELTNTLNKMINTFKVDPSAALPQ